MNSLVQSTYRAELNPATQVMIHNARGPLVQFIITRPDLARVGVRGDVAQVAEALSHTFIDLLETDEDPGLVLGALGVALDAQISHVEAGSPEEQRFRSAMGRFQATLRQWGYTGPPDVCEV